jgi:hypothetical protein
MLWTISRCKGFHSFQEVSDESPERLGSVAAKKEVSRVGVAVGGIRAQFATRVSNTVANAQTWKFGPAR